MAGSYQIKEGLEFLLGQQTADGFLSYSSHQPKRIGRARAYRTTFANALILSCLNDLTSWPEAKVIGSKLARLIRSQASSSWSFNYWLRNAAEQKTLPYPDDLDDTFVALAGLYRYDPALLPTDLAGRVAKLLTRNEQRVGGPYYTWLNPHHQRPNWDDVDLVVNANIKYFLSLLDVSLDSLTNLIEGAIERGDYSSRYYPTTFPVIYFISRSYRGAKREKIIAFLDRRRSADESWGTALPTALAISSWLNLGGRAEAVKSAIEKLIRLQKAGRWPAEAFCLDPAQKGRTYYAGSSALTTAFALEALEKYRRASAINPLATQSNRHRDQLSAQIRKRVRQRFQLVPRPLNILGLKVVDRLLDRDRDAEIILLPSRFAQSFGNQYPPLPTDLLKILGQLNLYGWLAYTIYDDFFDNEGRTELLPVANLALRELVSGYLELKLGKDFNRLLEKIMDRLDAANAAEVTTQRFDPRNCQTVPLVRPPNWTELADKSLGHALGPLAIVNYWREPLSGPLGRAVTQFFRHYLVARQLNDDAHDWEEDLLAGRVNSAGARVLGRHKLPSQSVSTQLPKLRQLFWQEVAEPFCRQILRQIRLARRAIKQAPGAESLDYFEALLTPIENSAEQALTERRQALGLIQLYRAG